MLRRRARSVPRLLGHPPVWVIPAERRQRVFAWLGFAARRQHAGRRMARAGAGLTAIEHRNIGAPGEPPRDAQPNHARADNDDARPFGDRSHRNSRCAQRGSLRWHDPDRFSGFDLSRMFRGTPGR